MKVQACPPGDVMIVDDNPANLKLLEDTFRQQCYGVRSFPRGRLALAAAAHNPPDLVLLDINMPEMDGYEVCKRLKEDPQLAAIPVIFLSALSATEDKVKGFRSGGVDYISKPFQLEEVQARVGTHLALRRAQQAEHELLEKTLNGAVSCLWELVQLTPAIAVRSRAIRDTVHWITEKMGLADSWQYELAATLCLVGCMTLPEDAFERSYVKGDLSSEEKRMFQSHPETAARLLLNIPRLEAVAEMIRYQQAPDVTPATSETVRMGARMLHLALELDRSVFRGTSFRSALQHLRKLPGRFDTRMLDALASYCPSPTQFERRSVPIHELRAGMVLERDIRTADSKLLLFKEGTVLTETWIERLGNFARLRRVAALVAVLVPSVSGVGKLGSPVGKP